MCKYKYNFFEGLPSYKKAIKAFLKKFKIPEKEFGVQFAQLCQNPFRGDKIPGFNHFWKYRIGIPKLNISKRDGFRLIYYLDSQNEGIMPAYIYFKPEKGNVTHNELDKLTKELDEALAKK